MDLRTTYLGLPLKNPLVPSSSPLSRDIDSAKQLEDAGASALVMNSLFEEEIIDEDINIDFLMQGQSLGNAEADSYLPLHDCYKNCLDLYLEQLQKLKQALDIPVIASLNGISNGGWIEHARDIEQAGADALELNIYYIPVNLKESGQDVEVRYLDILLAVKEQVSIPVTCKLSSQFSSPGHFIKQLESAGADGVSLFNRFYQPDINLKTLKIDPKLSLSSPYESLLRMHWIALLSGKTKLSLAATGGVHTAENVLKLLLVGADITHVCSVLLKQGPNVISEILDGMTQWMEDNDYESVEQLKGSISQGKAINPLAFERLNYLDVLQGYTGF
jgi:dihydroorotate dehydrogenase (fumarate)